MSAPLLDRGQARTWMVSLVVSVAIMAYLLSQIETGVLFETARGMTARPLAAFLLLLVGGVVARAVRFWLLLDRAVPFRLLVGVVLVRNLFVDLIPARLGELSYVYLLKRRAGRAVEEGLASLMLAVAFDVAALAPLLLLAFLVVGSGGALSGMWLAVAAATLGVIAIAGARLAAPLGRGVADLFAGSVRLEPLVRLVRQTATALDHTWARGIAVPVLAVSMVVRLCKFGSYFFLVVAVMDAVGSAAVELGFFRVFLGVVSAELAAALPIPTVASFGVFEAAGTYSCMEVGLSRELAILSGVLAHGTSQLIEYTMGIIALLVLMRPRTRTHG